MTNDGHVIESDDYRKEIEVLKKDSIILDMYDEIPALYLNDKKFLDSQEFVTSALKEYNRRSGQNAKSIGGPARALKALHKERQAQGDNA